MSSFRHHTYERSSKRIHNINWEKVLPDSGRKNKSICIISSSLQSGLRFWQPSFLLLPLNWLSCESNHLLCGWSTTCTCLGATTNGKVDVFGSRSGAQVFQLPFLHAIALTYIRRIYGAAATIIRSNQSNRRQHMVAAHGTPIFLRFYSFCRAANKILRFVNYIFWNVHVVPNRIP